MKSLNQFINESLIGDIILKILDKTLGWVDKGIDIVGDNIKTSVASSWDIVKEKTKGKDDAITNRYFKSEKEYTKTLTDTVFKQNGFKAKVDGIDKLMATMEKECNIQKDSELYDRVYCEHAYQVYLMSVNDKTLDDNQKKQAEVWYENLRRKFPKIIKEIETKNNNPKDKTKLAEYNNKVKKDLQDSTYKEKTDNKEGESGAEAKLPGETEKK